MRCILSTQKNIYFHLATEEFLLRNSDEEICMLWESDPAVVVGKHQNAMAEVNYLWATDNQIQVARRLSGGGTVYHGPGNLNFTFIRSGEKGKLVDFKRFVTPVVEYLQKLGVHAGIGTRNDILIHDLKVSGNAEHVYKTRVLHHGTLLYNANLDMLNTSIKVPKNKYFGKAVASVRSQVTNISGEMKKPMSFEHFTLGLFDYLTEYFPQSERSEFSEDELEAIETLHREKYAQWQWIYGYSPAFEVRKEILWNGREMQIILKIKKGIVELVDIRINDDRGFAKSVEQALLQTEYRLNSTIRALDKIGPAGTDSELLSRLFY